MGESLVEPVGPPQCDSQQVAVVDVLTILEDGLPESIGRLQPTLLTDVDFPDHTETDRARLGVACGAPGVFQGRRLVA